MKKILILGGYGNFGSKIAVALLKLNIDIIIVGRNKAKTLALVNNLQKDYPNKNIEGAVFDAHINLSSQLKLYKPIVVINTIGPFQNENYDIAEICISAKVNYIDLADGRDFVTGIDQLNNQAKKMSVAVISGASTVPGLSSAIMEEYKDEFSEIEKLTYGITPGQKAERGLATTKGILSYIGKPLKPISTSKKTRYGWQDIYRQEYPTLGKRWMANCDIPDLDLLPKKYGIKNIYFSAGMESTLLHLGIWLLAWIIRLGLPINLAKHASFLLYISHWFDFLGTADGGMHMIIQGKDKNNKAHEVKCFVIAKNSSGPQIPTIPAIILAKQLVSGELKYTGACACVGMISLEEYLLALKQFDIEFIKLNYK